MNKLLIHAHPSATWFNAALCDEIMEKASAAGHQVKIIDLYREYPQPFLTFHPDSPIPYIQEINSLLRRADELIFIFPIRWIDCPAILKNFFDVNFNKGLWYTFTPTGKRVWLFQWKKARIIATAGWPGFFYPLIRFVSRTIGKFWYCGIKHLSTSVLSHTVKTTDAKRQAFMHKVAKICSK